MFRRPPTAALLAAVAACLLAPATPVLADSHKKKSDEIPNRVQDRKYAGKLVIAAASIRDVVREYSDGRKERACQVIFQLMNRTGQKLHRSRFWVVAANGKRESFGLSDRKIKNRERFDNTACSDVRGKLKLRRALCQWVGADKPENCAARVLIDVK